MVMMRRILTVLILLLFCLVNVLRAQGQEIQAQEVQENQEEQEEKKKTDKKPDHRHQMFLKFGFVHTGSEIESFRIVVNGISVDLETYFNKNHAGFSGWFVGYRKDDTRFADFGHFINFGMFRVIGIPAMDLKISGGLEWGSPSLDFSKTRFSYRNGVLESYENLFLKKNFGVPKTEPSGDAVLYPFAEASILKRWRYILVETGVRGNIQSFGFDRYELAGDSLEFSSRDKTVIVPAVFIKFGLFFPPW